MEDHVALKGSIDGNRLITVTNWAVTFESGDQRVDTLEGLAGKTPGSGSVEITGTFAVPKNGLEFDFLEAVALKRYHTIQIVVGAKTIVSEGWFQNSGVSQGVNANTEATMSFTGELQPPEG